jgi:hypothetical protein
MRYLLIVVALAAGCSGSPTVPTSPPFARLTVASGPTLGTCAGATCTYTVDVLNSGPACASGVTVSVTSTVGQAGGRIAVAVIQASVPGIVRAGQVVTVGGSDWPVDGVRPTTSVRGDGVSCP